MVPQRGPPNDVELVQGFQACRHHPPAEFASQLPVLFAAKFSVSPTTSVFQLIASLPVASFDARETATRDGVIPVSDPAQVKCRSLIFGAVAQVGRALDWQSRGQGFKSPQLHKKGLVVAPFFQIVGSGGFWQSTIGPTNPRLPSCDSPVAVLLPSRCIYPAGPMNGCPWSP